MSNYYNLIKRTLMRLEMGLLNVNQWHLMRIVGTYNTNMNYITLDITLKVEETFFDHILFSINKNFIKFSMCFLCPTRLRLDF